MATSSFYNSSGSTPTAQNTIATSVTQAATSATQAATSATQANTSATNAQNSLNSFQQYYLGTYTTAPSTSQVGALYFNSSTGQLFVWDGTSWNVTTTASNINNTDDLTEGSSNLYFTSERVDDRVNGLLTAGSNITLAYDDVANTLTIASTGGLTDLSASTTNDLTEGSSNLYFTNARATSAITGSDLDMAGNKVLFGNVYSAESDLPSASTYHGMFAHVHATGKGYFAHAGSWHKLLDETSSTTSNLTEGSNLYYTDERVDDRVNALLTAGSNITLTYDDAANTLTIASTASGGGGGGGSTTFTGLTDTPSSMGTSGQYLAVNSGGTALEFVAAPSGGSGGSSTFTGLSDTPSSFTASKFVAVNSGGTALEYVNALTPTGLTVTNNAASGGGSLSYIPSGSANSATLSFIPPDLSGYATTASLATVATSGAYSDLTGTPNLSGYLTGITGESLYSLSNVYTSSSPTDGQVLTWDNANSYWKPTTVSGGSGGIALTDLSATTGTASGGGSLSYNSVSGQFTLNPPNLSSYATTASLATVATSGAYSDLTGTPTALTNTDALTEGSTNLYHTTARARSSVSAVTGAVASGGGNLSYNSINGEFTFTKPDLSSYLTNITGQSLYSLSNVNTSASPSDGQVLTWSNANSYWTPTTVSSGSAPPWLATTSTTAATTNTRAKSLALGSGATVNAGNSVGSALQKAIAIGDNATVAGTQGIIIGTDQTVEYASTVVAASEGVLNNGTGQNCTVIGDGYHITGNNRNGVTLLGAGTLGTDYSTAVGYLADAQHSYSVALGYDATSTQANQLILGDDTNTQGFTSIRVGNNSYQPSNAKDLTSKDYVDNRQLANLSDVDGTQPTDGQVLTWDNTNAYWYPATASGGGGGGSSYLDVNSSGTAASATGTEGIAIGASASSASNYAVLVGYGTTATGANGIAIGRSAEADGQHGMGLGYLAKGQHLRSTAIGYNAETTQGDQLMLGTTSSYGGFTSIRVGNTNYTPSNAMDLATKQYVDANAGGGGSASNINVVGSGTATASGANSVSIGNSATTSTNTGAVAIGGSASVTDNNGVAVGFGASVAGGNSGVAIGTATSTGVYGPVAIGYFSYAGSYSTAVGNGYSASTGNRCWAAYTGVSIGYQASGQANNTTTIGGFSGCTTSAHNGTAVGYGAASAGSNGTALGNGALAYGNQFVLGNSSINNLKCQDTSITAVSDSRDKTNIETLTIGLDFVNAVEPKAFYKNNRSEYYSAQYTDHELNENDSLTQSYIFDQTAYDAGTQKFDQREFGFIAQDVAAQLPDTYSDARVSYNETDDKYGYDVQRFTMGDMTPILWKALRELSDKHDQLQSDYDALLARVVALENA